MVGESFEIGWFYRTSFKGLAHKVFAVFSNTLQSIFLSMELLLHVYNYLALCLTSYEQRLGG